MSFFTEVVQKLEKIPTVTSRSAERIAFSLIKMEKKEVFALLSSIENLLNKTSFCSICGLLSEYNPCKICQSNKRDKSIICVVSNIEDAIAIEKDRIYNGLYHVIRGLLSPVNNIFEENLQIEKLIKRISPTLKKIVFALEESMEAEATITFLKEKINSKSLIFSRIEKNN